MFKTTKIKYPRYHIAVTRVLLNQNFSISPFEFYILFLVISLNSSPAHRTMDVVPTIIPNRSNLEEQH